MNESKRSADQLSSEVRSLPENAELYRLRKEAKLFLKRLRAKDDDAIAAATRYYRGFDISTARLSDAQLVVARSYGFSSWPKLAAHLQSIQPPTEVDPLHYKEVFGAVQQGDRDKVMSMIDADESVLDITDARQITPLTVAFAYGQLEMAHALIERGANVFAMNHSDKWGMRYITERSGLPDTDRERFVETAIKARVWDQEIFHAVWRRDTATAKTILADDSSLASIRLAIPEGANGYYNSLPYCGLTPLHYAVIAGDEAMVRTLLKAGAEVDAIPHAHEPDSRHTPLYLVPEGCESIAELLIEHGADVNHTTSYLSEGSQSMRKVVVANGAGGTPLMAALTIGELDKAAQIIRDDPSVIHDRLTDSRIETPLHMAVKANSAEVIELLIENGMDVDTPTSRGFTALAMAPEMYCTFDTIRLLVERGADVRTGSDSPLYAAIWQHAYGHWDYEAVIRYFVEQGSQPRGLCSCAQGGNLGLTKLLVELGADINETDESGFYSKPPWSTGHTALDYCTGVAGKHEHPDVADFLRQCGAKHASDLG